MCALGLLVFHQTLERTHLLGPAAGVGALSIAGAVAIDSAPLEGRGLEALLAALILVGTGPVLSHAIARAAASFGVESREPPLGEQGKP